MYWLPCFPGPQERDPGLRPVVLSLYPYDPPGLPDSGSDVGRDCLDIVFGRSNRTFGFHFADDGDVVESYVSPAANAVEEIEERRQCGIEVPSSELNDRDVMLELHAGTLPVAQHQRRVPHPWRVLVFAPRVGYHKPQLADLIVL